MSSCLCSKIDTASTVSSIKVQALIELTDYAGNTAFDKMLLINFDSANAAQTSFTATMIHYSNYVTNLNFGFFLGTDNFLVVGHSTSLNGVSFATQRALTVVYPAPTLYCGTTITTQTLTFITGLIDFQGI